jgi:DNA repair protein REV1
MHSFVYLFKSTRITGHSELVARLATRKAKPNGQFYVQKHEVNGFVKEMPLSSIPGIGYSLMEKLQETFGQAKICKDLYSVQLSRLQTLLGEKQGKKVCLFAVIN